MTKVSKVNEAGRGIGMDWVRSRNARTWRSSYGRALDAAVLACCALVIAACTPATEPARCDRFDVPSMGPENGFRVTVADAVPGLDGAPSRIDVAVASPVPLTGPVTLVQSSGGRELARWELTFPHAPGLVQRCSLGYVASTCGATLTARPQNAAGEWRIEQGANRLLEASIAFRHCAGAKDSGY
jgi:hypothetical protein